MMHKAPKVEKMMTLWVKFPEGTLYGLPLARPYIELKTHGKPRPRNTLTLLLPKKNNVIHVQHIIDTNKNRRVLSAFPSKKYIPVTFPIAASACSSCMAAVRLANVSGKLVPKAIIVIPVTLVFKPTTHPSKCPSC